jgi:hypothetical protein
MKAALIVFILLLGLDLHGRWTGESYSFDFFGSNGLGNAIKKAGG